MIERSGDMSASRAEVDQAAVQCVSKCVTAFAQGATA